MVLLQLWVEPLVGSSTRVLVVLCLKQTIEHFADSWGCGWCRLLWRWSIPHADFPILHKTSRKTTTNTPEQEDRGAYAHHDRSCQGRCPSWIERTSESKGHLNRKLRTPQFAATWSKHFFMCLRANSCSLSDILSLVTVTSCFAILGCHCIAWYSALNMLARVIVLSSDDIVYTIFRFSLSAYWSHPFSMNARV